MPTDLLRKLGIDPVNPGAHDGVAPLETSDGGELDSFNPADGSVLARIRTAGPADYERLMSKATAGFERWRSMPAPRRGEVVRQVGDALRARKQDLGRLVSLEVGKILPEGEGEVQEMIDIADFAVGLSRQLYGRTMHSERPKHRMYEQWHPLGVVGIISAFNFPVAVWSWNAMVAAACGDAMVWKPSSKAPLCALAVQNVIRPVLEANGVEGVFNLVIGSSRDVGEQLLADRRVPLVSATGSCRMGARVAQVVGGRFGRTILELGGNNGVIVLDDADPDLVVRAVLFGAVGTAGQRCTSTRRLFLHEGIYDRVMDQLVKAYRSVRIGDPLDPGTLMGPLIDESAVTGMQEALEKAREQGGEVVTGGGVLDRPGWFVEPAIVAARPGMDIYRHETFAPILYAFRVRNYEEALALHNEVDQGLSSAIFTNDLRKAEAFLGATGSDCGIANVNIGTSGAEIGGAFGGEKDTGGGREAGSDAWKAYMRRQTNTINFGSELPLAQGVRFDV